MSGTKEEQGYMGGYPQAQLGYPPVAGAYGGYPSQPGGYGAPPTAGFIYPGTTGGMGGPSMHSAYGIPDDGSGPKPYSNESASSYGDLNGIDFSERSIRMAFIRKVYGILSIQLLATTGLIALFCFHHDAKMWIRQNYGIAIGSYVVAIILLIAMACCENLRRKSPHNFILLGLFTLTYGVVIGVIASKYDVNDVVLAAGVTVVVCVALTIFSFQTKYDFTMMGGALFVCMIVLFLFSFIAIFFGPTFRLVLAFFGTILFSLYLVYDTQLMIGGNHKYSISPEEYVFASLNIYMDIIMIFIYLLRIFGSDN